VSISDAGGLSAGHGRVIAANLRQPPEGCSFHSDRGSQYSADDYQKRLQRYGLRPSISGKRNCHDNAAAETFSKSLKAELLWRQTWPTQRRAEAAIFYYINGLYTARRKKFVSGRHQPPSIRSQGRVVELLISIKMLKVHENQGFFSHARLDQAVLTKFFNHSRAAARLRKLSNDRIVLL